MRQCNSSKDFYKVGTTLLNCNFSLSVFIEDVANYADRKGHLRQSEKEYFKKHANSAKSFPILSFVIDRMNSYSCLPIPTKYGNIIKMAEGYSKMALIIETSQGEKFVMKFDKSFDNSIIDKCKTYKELRHETSANNADNQTAKQAETYDLWRDKTDIGHYILPVFRYYKRYNVLIEPFVSIIGSLSECCEITGTDHNMMIDICNRYSLYDVTNNNSGNCGVINGRLYIIDYAL